MNSTGSNVPVPFAAGVEGAGVVEAIGKDVSKLKIGDRVGYYFSFGSYADVRLIDVDALVKLPDDVSAEQSAAILAKGLTAWMLVKRVHTITAGETVLVHAAAGGVGSLLTSWAQTLGAKVIATVGTPAKAQTVCQHGIEHVLDANDPYLVTRILSMTEGRGVDVVYELDRRAAASCRDPWRGHATRPRSGGNRRRQRPPARRRST